MTNLLKNIAFCSVLLFFLQSCGSQKSSSPTSESMESTETATNQDKEESKKDDFADVDAVTEEVPNVNELSESKPLNQLSIPEQKFTIERVITFKDSQGNSNVSSGSSSENEQLSVSNKHAKVLLFAKKLQKGSYPIAKNSLPYATVHVTLQQGTEKIEGDLENGTVKLLLLDSAGITKGSFEGTLIKNNERYFIGGNFSN